MKPALLGIKVDDFEADDTLNWLTNEAVDGTTEPVDWMAVRSRLSKETVLPGIIYYTCTLQYTK